MLVGWAIWKLAYGLFIFGITHGKSIEQILKKSEHLFDFDLIVSVA
jgi:hypothetical protein